MSDLGQSATCLIGNIGRARHMPKEGYGGKRVRWWGVLWEPRDLWLGVYWDRPKATGWDRALDVYVCIVPCLPLKIEARRMVPQMHVGVQGV